MVGAGRSVGQDRLDGVVVVPDGGCPRRESLQDPDDHTGGPAAVAFEAELALRVSKTNSTVRRTRVSRWVPGRGLLCGRVLRRRVNPGAAKAADRGCASTPGLTTPLMTRRVSLWQQLLRHQPRFQPRVWWTGLDSTRASRLEIGFQRRVWTISPPSKSHAPHQSPWNQAPSGRPRANAGAVRAGRPLRRRLARRRRRPGTPR